MKGGVAQASLETIVLVAISRSHGIDMKRDDQYERVELMILGLDDQALRM